MIRKGPEAHRPHLLTLSQAAQQVGIGVKRLRLARDRGELTVYQLGERWQRVTWDAVLGWLDKHKYQHDQGGSSTQ